jgi:hypothetical protein
MKPSVLCRNERRQYLGPVKNKYYKISHLGYECETFGGIRYYRNQDNSDIEEESSGLLLEFRT